MQRRFQEALLAGDLDAVKALIDDGCHFDKHDNLGNNNLMKAAYEGHLNLVEYFVANGFDVNDKNHFGLTALHFAASRGSNDVARFLVDHHAKVDVYDEDGNSPLMYAVRNGCFEVAETLAKAGGNVNDQTVIKELDEFDEPTGVSYRNTLLMDALMQYMVIKEESVKQRFLDGMRMLIDQGADIDKKNSFDTSFRDLAKTFKLQAIVDLVDDVEQSVTVMR